MAIATFTRDAQTRGGLIVDCKVTLRHGADDPVVFAKAQLCLPEGPTDARVMAFGGPTRALSDGRGQVKGYAASLRLIDRDNEIRSWMDDPARDDIDNYEITCEAISRAQRLDGYDWRRVYRGVLTDPQFLPGREVIFRVEDPFTQTFGLPVPFYKISRDQFPSAPAASVGLPVSPVYGRQSDEVDSTAPPVPTFEPARGAYWVPGPLLFAGYADEPGTPATGVTLTRNAGAGVFTPGGLTSNRLYGYVVAIHSGVRSSPAPFVVTDLFADIEADGDAFTFDWTPASGGADSYECYLAIIESAEVRFFAKRTVGGGATSCQFTGDNHDGITFAVRRVWSVAALMPGGETQLSDRIAIYAAPYERPVHLAWSQVTGNQGYAVYEQISAHGGMPWIGRIETAEDVNEYTREWAVPLPEILAQPGALGVVPAVDCGDWLDLNGETWGIFLFGHGACKQVQNGFIDHVLVDASRFLAGGDVGLPGLGDYATIFGADPFLDIGDYRFTPGFLRGTALDQVRNQGLSFTINVLGADTNGDTTGDLIEAREAIYQHLLDNFILRRDDDAYRGGAWLSAPTFSDGVAKYDAASFVAAAATQLPSAPAEGIGLWRTAVTRQTLIAELNVNTGFNSTFNAEGQLRVAFWWPYNTGVVTVTQNEDLRARGLTFSQTKQYLENVTPFSWRPNYVAGSLDISSTYRHNASINKYGEKPRADSPIAFTMHRQSTAPIALAELHARRFAWPLRTGVLNVAGLHTMAVEPGDTVYGKSRDGTGPDGWTAKALRVEGVTVAMDGKNVDLLFEDYRRQDFLSDAEVDELHSDLELGGSWYHSPALSDDATQTVKAYEWRTCQVNWGAIPSTAHADVHVNAKVEVGTIGLTPIIYDVTDPDAPVVAKRGTEVTATAFEQQIITLDRPIDGSARRYELWAEITDADSTKAVHFLAAIRTVVGTPPKVATATVTGNESLTTSASDQVLNVDADVTSVFTVTTGTVTFRLRTSGGVAVGSAATVNVDGGGHADANITVPGGTPAGIYVLSAEYNGTDHLSPSSDEKTVTISAPVSQRLYLSKAAAPYTPATIRGTYDSTVGAVTKALVDSKSPSTGGQLFAVSQNVSAAEYAMLVYRGVSTARRAQTVAGTAYLVIPCQIFGLFAPAYLGLHVYVTQGDSDTPRLTLVNNYQSTVNVLPGGSNWGEAIDSAQTMTGGAIQDGDRVVVEVSFVFRPAVAFVVDDVAHMWAAADTGYSDAAIDAGQLRNPFIEFSQAIEAL